MILEALVTTLSAAGELNLAPMGPHLNGPLESGFVLKPFQTSTTYANLKQQRAGVLHVTDDVLLLAQAAIGKLASPPATFRAQRIAGQVLANACRYVEFEVTEFDTSGPRAVARCRVVQSRILREHFGFNRGKHAVLEAAILATRVHLLDRAEILGEFAKFEVIVEKTAGPAEHRAMQLLREYVEQMEVGQQPVRKPPTLA